MHYSHFLVLIVFVYVHPFFLFYLIRYNRYCTCKRSENISNVNLCNTIVEKINQQMDHCPLLTVEGSSPCYMMLWTEVSLRRLMERTLYLAFPMH